MLKDKHTALAFSSGHISPHRMLLQPTNKILNKQLIADFTNNI